MTRLNVALSVIALVLLFLLLVVVTGQPSQAPRIALPAPRPPSPRFLTMSLTQSAGGWKLGLMGDPGIILSADAHFSSKRDALAAQKLLREAIRWADPTVRITMPD